MKAFCFGVRTLTLPVLVLLAMPPVCSSHAVGAVLNPSFEEPPATSRLPEWDFTRSGELSGGRDDDFTTDGDWHGRLFSRCFSGVACPVFAAGDFASFTQVVDLSLVRTLVLDVETRQGGGRLLDWDPDFEATIRIDSTKLWSSNSAQSVIDLSLDMSAYTGMHLLEFQLEALDDVSSATGSNHFRFDNLRTVAVPEPSAGILAAVGLALLAFVCRVHGVWRACYPQDGTIVPSARTVTESDHCPVGSPVIGTDCAGVGSHC